MCSVLLSELNHQHRCFLWTPLLRTLCAGCLTHTSQMDSQFCSQLYEQCKPEIWESHPTPRFSFLHWWQSNWWCALRGFPAYYLSQPFTLYLLLNIQPPSPQKCGSFSNSFSRLQRVEFPKFHGWNPGHLTFPRQPAPAYPACLTGLSTEHSPPYHTPATCPSFRVHPVPWLHSSYTLACLTGMPPLNLPR